MHIVLFEPLIPPNTGNIARTCAATATVLHLVAPLGFRVDDAAVRRAGLDYWHLVDLRLHDSLPEVVEQARQAGSTCHFFSKFARRSYADAAYAADDYLIFGKETTGLPDYIHTQYPEALLRIPMLPSGVRSLNLSNSVALVVYEALRQQDFPGLL